MALPCSLPNLFLSLFLPESFSSSSLPAFCALVDEKKKEGINDSLFFTCTVDDQSSDSDEYDTAWTSIEILVYLPHKQSRQDEFKVWSLFLHLFFLFLLSSLFSLFRLFFHLFFHLFFLPSFFLLSSFSSLSLTVVQPVMHVHQYSVFPNWSTWGQPKEEVHRIEAGPKTQTLLNTLEGVFGLGTPMNSLRAMMLLLFFLQTEVTLFTLVMLILFTLNSKVVYCICFYSFYSKKRRRLSFFRAQTSKKHRFYLNFITTISTSNLPLTPLLSCEVAH